VSVAPRPDPAGAGEGPACPFLRLESAAGLLDPVPAPDGRHRCVAIDGPRLVSAQQQELVCLGPAHVDCPRFRRATARPGGLGARLPAMPPAIAASLAVLALSATISFGFVVARGGIDLPAGTGSSGATGGPGGAVASGATVLPSAPGSAPTAPVEASASPGGGAGASQGAGAGPGQTGAPEPSPSRAPEASGSPAPSGSPARTAPPASPSAAPGGGPSASRLAVLKPCPGKSGCYVYTIRAGDNLYSIAHWFGVPLDTVYAWNPAVKSGIRPGMAIRIPTPTR